MTYLAFRFWIKRKLFARHNFSAALYCLATVRKIFGLDSAFLPGRPGCWLPTLALTGLAANLDLHLNMATCDTLALYMQGAYERLPDALVRNLTEIWVTWRKTGDCLLSCNLTLWTICQSWRPAGCHPVARWSSGCSYGLWRFPPGWSAKCGPFFPTAHSRTGLIFEENCGLIFRTLMGWGPWPRSLNMLVLPSLQWVQAS